MRRKIKTIIITIIIWLVAFLIFCVWQFIRISKPHEYTVNNDAVYISDAWFVTDNNAQAGGIIMRIAANGNVDAVFTTAEDHFLKGFYIDNIDAATEERPAAIFSREVDDNGRMIRQYCVAEFNEALQPIYISPIFRLPQEMTQSGFSADEDMLYITALSKSRQQTYVYTIPSSALIDAKENDNDAVSKWKEKRAEVNEYTLQECVLPRYFVDAEYAGGTLNVRFDNSEPGYFALNRDVREVYENKKMDTPATIRVAGFDTSVLVLAAVIGSLFIVLLFIIFNERRRVVYAVAALEIFMLVICAGSVLVLDHENRLNARDEHIRYSQLDAVGIMDGYALVDLNSEDIYETADYEVLSARIRRRIGDNKPVSDVLLVNSISGRIIMSAGGKNRGYISEKYGSSIMDMMQETAGGDAYSIRDIDNEGWNMTVLAVNLAPAGHADMSMIYETEGNSFFEDLVTGLGTYIKLIVGLFAAGSIVGIIFLLIQSADLLQLQNALGELSKGDNTVIDKPAVVGRDMNYMWNSVMEICKNVANNNRIKFLTYEAYFRFAPKSIERILNRNSITEVHGGDMSASNGTIACLRLGEADLSGRAELESKNALMTITEECRDEFDGIFISHESDLSEMKFLFLEDNTSSTAFGTELILKLKEERRRTFSRPAMLLHYAPYVYGVAGDQRQAAVYLSSPEYDLLSKYVNWFSDMNLGLVATQPLLEHENFRGESRYIGFIIPDPDKPERKIKLYELMEAELPEVRSNRTSQKPRFEEALRLFFEKDFYIARSRFSEVLRVSPDDEISKWYLFECERYLNDENASNNFVGNLHL